MTARRTIFPLALALALAAAIGGVIAIAVLVGGSSRRADVANPAPRTARDDGSLRGRADSTAPPAPSAHPATVLSCADVETAHQQAVKADAAAFANALADRRLTPLALDARPLGPFTSYGAPALERATPAWTEVTAKLDGKPRQLLLGDIVDQPSGMPSQPELVIDEAGDIWRITRALTLSPRDIADVRTCAWGCWGQAPSGIDRAPSFHRGRWVLPPGHHLRGTLTIPYTTYGLTVNIVDAHCALPL